MFRLDVEVIVHGSSSSRTMSTRVLAVPRIYPKSPLLLLAVAARVGAYPKSRLSLLELGLTAPQACVASRRRVCYPCSGAGMRLLLGPCVCGFVRIFDCLIVRLVITGSTSFRFFLFCVSYSYPLRVQLGGSVTEIPPVPPGTPSATPRLPSGIPHPVVGRASVGAWASCSVHHRTRVRTARRGCHSRDAQSM